MEVRLHIEVSEKLAELAKGKRSNPRMVKKINNTLRLLAADHRHPSLASHRYETWDSVYGEAMWESYIEQNTPSAWRMWWFFGPEDGQITVVEVGPHP